MPVAPGIITNGLGGNTSNMILGHFHLGFFEVIIEDIPGGRDYVDAKPYPKQKVQVTFKIKYKDKKWHKTYLVDEEKTPIIIKITNMINTVTTKISVTVANMRKRLKIFRILK